MKLRSRMVTFGLLLAGNLLSARADADPYPPVDQKRPALVLKSHGIFWAGGRIVNRTQSGTQNAGDLKNIPYNQQQVLVGQAYVEYFIPHKLRNGKNTPPVVMVPGGALIGVHFLTTPDGREGWAHYFLRRGFPVYIVDVPGREQRMKSRPQRHIFGIWLGWIRIGASGRSISRSALVGTPGAAHGTA